MSCGGCGMVSGGDVPAAAGSGSGGGVAFAAERGRLLPVPAWAGPAPLRLGRVMSATDDLSSPDSCHSLDEHCRSMQGTVLILGCGYAGSRVATRLLRRGLTVHVTATSPDGLE